MSRLSAFTEAEQLPLDGMLIAIRGGKGLCPNRISCLVHRLNVTWEALEKGHRCAFEEQGVLWQCHLSDVLRGMDEG